MEKLAGLGPVRSQPTRPKMFAALPVDTVVARVVDIARDRAERFAAAAPALAGHRADLRHVTGVRYSGELGHPFPVVDDETVIVPLDHPFVKEGRFASL